MTTRRLDLTRTKILAYRRNVQALDRRVPPGPESLRHVAWAGLQDSMPRAALLSIHARVDGTAPSTWEDPSLVQLWGPRFSAYVVAARDLAVFTLGRLPDDAERRLFAEDMATRLHVFLRGRKITYGEAGRALGVHPNALRYGAPTGRVLIRWEGARQPTVWTVPAPDVDPRDARLELARRYLHIFGPATPGAFAQWAGVRPARDRSPFDALSESLTPVRTPVGDAWILTSDEQTFRAPAEPAASARLLPSGDAYFLLQGADRELLVPKSDRRAALWTSRVWPGAVLVRGEVAGTWRRAGPAVTIESWRRLAREERGWIEAEADSLPLPDIRARIRVRWDVDRRSTVGLTSGRDG
jgi:winged helix DNA-binding protein